MESLGMATLFYQFRASSGNRYFYTEMAILFFSKSTLEGKKKTLESHRF